MLIRRFIHTARKFGKKQRGQSVVELALVTPMLLFLLIGTLDLGRVFYALMAVSNSAYNGAFHASVTPADCASPVGATLQTRVHNELSLLGTGSVTITCTTGNDGWTYSGSTNFRYVHVTVTYI